MDIHRGLSLQGEHFSVIYDDERHISMPMKIPTKGGQCIHERKDKRRECLDDTVKTQRLRNLNMGIESADSVVVAILLDKYNKN